MVNFLTDKLMIFPSSFCAFAAVDDQMIMMVMAVQWSLVGHQRSHCLIERESIVHGS